MADENLGDLGFDATLAIKTLDNLDQSIVKLNKTIDAFNQNLSTFNTVGQKIDSVLSGALRTSQTASAGISKAFKEINPSTLALQFANLKKDLQLDQLDAPASQLAKINKAIESLKQQASKLPKNAVEQFFKQFQLGQQLPVVPKAESLTIGLQKVIDMYRQAARASTDFSAAQQLAAKNQPKTLPGVSNNSLIAAQQKAANAIGKTNLSLTEQEKIAQNLGQVYTGQSATVASALRAQQTAVDRLNASQARQISQNQNAINSILAIGDASRRTQANMQAAATASDLLGSRIQNIGKASPQQFALIQNSLNRVTRLVESGKVSLANLDSAFTKLGSGGIKTFTGAERDAAAALSQFVQAVQRGGGSIDGFNAKLASGTGSVSKFGTQLQKLQPLVLGVFGGNLLSQGASRLQSALEGSASAGAKFSTQIALVETIAGETNLSTQELATNLRAISDASAQPLPVVSEGLYNALSNQVGNASESLRFLSSAQNLAISTNSSLADSINILTSIINAYDLSIDESTKLSDQLFRLVDLGDVKINQLGDSFGRILPLARQIGVDFTTVAGAMETLTIQGIPVEDSMTLLRNLFVQTAKPTKALTNLFKELGFASPELALRGLGLVDFLKTIKDETNGSTSALSKLFDEIRAVSAVAALGANLDKLGSNIQKTADSQNAAVQAAGTVLDSVGTQFDKITNKVKNFFTVDIGLNLAKNLVLINNNVIGVDTAVQLVTKSLAIGAAAWGTYVLAARVGAITTGTIALAGNIAAVTAAVNTSSKAWALFNTVISANPIFAGFAAGLAIGAIINALSEQDQSLEEAARRSQQFFDEQKAQTETQVKALKDGFAQQDKEYDTFYKEQTKKVADFYRSYIREQNKNLGVLNQDFENYANDYKFAFQTIEKAGQDAISKTQKQVRGLQQDIEQAQSIVQNANISFEKDAFDRKLSITPQLKQPQVIQKQIDSLQTKGVQAFNAKNLKLGQDYFEQALDLANKLFDKQVEINQQLGRQPSQGTANIEAKINNLWATRNKLVDQFLKKQQAAAKALQDQETAQRDAVTKLKTGIADLKGFDIFDKGGNLKPELDTVKEIDDAIKKIQDDTHKPLEILNIGDQLQAIQLLDRNIAATRERAVTQLNANVIESQAQADKQILTNAKNAEQQAKNSRDRALGAFTDLKTSALKTADAVSAGLQVQIKQQRQPLSADATGLDITAHAEQLQKDAQDIDLLSQAFIKLQEATDPQALTERAQDFENLVNAISKARGIDLQTAGVESGNLLGTPQSFDAIQTKLDAVTSAYITAGQKIEAARKQMASGGPIDLDVKINTQTLIDQINAANKAIDGIPSNKELKLEVQGINEHLTELDAIKNGWDVIIQDVNTYARDVSNLPGPPGLDTNIIGRRFGGIVGFANGGLIGNAFSSPGPDNQIIAARRGEFVVPAGPTRDFYPQLEALRAGMDPFQAGTNNTNVGGINITVNGGSTAAQTINEIGRGLKREIRAGRIKLS